MDFFEAYGQLAEKISSKTLLSGRNVFQAEAEKYIPRDVANKLKLTRSDRLLEIGCGVGVILTPLSKLVKEAVGLDHASVIKKYQQDGVPENVTLVDGRWPETKVTGTFDKILVYGVIHYLDGQKATNNFIRQCLRVLNPGGLLLIGDIPNNDAANRFLNSQSGQETHKQYVAQKAKFAKHQESLLTQATFLAAEPAKQFLNDNYILWLLSSLRQDGFESYILPEPEELPISRSREDILIYKRP